MRTKVETILHSTAQSPEKRVCEEEEAQRSERAFAEDGSEGYGVCADEVKLIRAQGECLGIKSR